MQRLFIPNSFQEESDRCPTCQRLGELDQSALACEMRLSEYARLLRKLAVVLAGAGEGALVEQAFAVHDRLEEFAECARDQTEVHRCAHGLNCFLYFATEQFDGLDNRLRKGVQAHEQSIAESQRLLEESVRLFMVLDTAQRALFDACPAAVAERDMLRTAFQALSEANEEVQRRARAYWEQLASYMSARRAAAFAITMPTE